MSGTTTVSRKPKTAAQLAASRRNLQKANEANARKRKDARVLAGAAGAEDDNIEDTPRETAPVRLALADGVVESSGLSAGAEVFTPSGLVAGGGWEVAMPSVLAPPGLSRGEASGADTHAADTLTVSIGRGSTLTLTPDDIICAECGYVIAEAWWTTCVTCAAPLHADCAVRGRDALGPTDDFTCVPCGKKAAKALEGYPRKSVPNQSRKRYWGILRPSSPQDRPKTAKNVQNGVRGSSPGSKLGPKIDAKSTPKPSKRNTFLYSFSDRVLTPPGTDFHRIRGPKMEQKSTQNRCPERSCRKCKILKKP